jgi:hypothetical protein
LALAANLHRLPQSAMLPQLMPAVTAEKPQRSYRGAKEKLR